MHTCCDRCALPLFITLVSILCMFDVLFHTSNTKQSLNSACTPTCSPLIVTIIVTVWRLADHTNRNASLLSSLTDIKYPPSIRRCWAWHTVEHGSLRPLSAVILLVLAAVIIPCCPPSHRRDRKQQGVAMMMMMLIGRPARPSESWSS